VSRYEFPAFDLGSVAVFANSADPAPLELRQAAFADAELNAILHAGRMIAIGRTIGGCPDPICFDGRAKREDHELPLVRVDHQAAKERHELAVVSAIAPSFLAMVSQLL
jgi:hypothetical protein